MDGMDLEGEDEEEDERMDSDVPSVSASISASSSPERSEIHQLTSFGPSRSCPYAYSR